MINFYKRKLVINNRQHWLYKSSFLLFIFIFTQNIHRSYGHGRLIEPPSRASAWRYGFNTPPDYNDHELYCGGFTRQWKRNEGKCGVCGDAWDMPEPRPHEHGGQYGKGVIVRRYLPKAKITIRVELTASHLGYFEFRLCAEPNANQECLDRNLLIVIGGSPAQVSPNDLNTRFYPRNGSRIYEIKAQLPELTCDQCLLQWRYVAGNNWGMCPDGNGAVGCGPQEEFRSCADIALGSVLKMPVRPPMHSTVRPITISNSTETNGSKEFSEFPNYVPLLVVFILLFLGLVILAMWYLYRINHPVIGRYKDYMNKSFCKKNPISTTTPATKKSKTRNEIPVPPPRLKRPFRVKEISPDESSIA